MSLEAQLFVDERKNLLVASGEALGDFPHFQGIGKVSKRVIIACPTRRL